MASTPRRRRDITTKNAGAPSAAERSRVAEILAPDVALYRDAQRLWQTYKDDFGGNATAPEGATGRRAGRRAERRAAQQMVRQRRRVVSG